MKKVLVGLSALLVASVMGNIALVVQNNRLANALSLSKAAAVEPLSELPSAGIEFAEENCPLVSNICMGTDGTIYE